MDQQSNLPYYERTRGKSLSDFIEEPEFQQDLVDFFQSSRYNYSADKIKSMKPKDLADEFFTHMRWQSSNEATAVRDLQFAMSDTLNDPNIQRGKDAFGRLMIAWDESEGEDMSAGVLGDYFMGTLVSPSTAVSVLTAGLGSAPAKVTALAAKEGALIAMRQALKSGIKRQTVGQAVRIGAARAAAVEGTLGASMEFINQQTRDEAVSEYDVDMAEVAFAGGASALFGGVIGGATRGILQAKSKNVGADLIEQAFTETMRRQFASQGTVTAAISQVKDSKVLDAALENVVDYASMLAEAATGKGYNRYDTRPSLDREMVKLGERVKSAVLEGYTKDDLPYFMSLGIAPDQLQKVAAASVELVNRLGITADDLKTTRITQLIADRNDGEQILLDVKKRLGLTADEISAVFVSEFSRAGKTLQIASQLRKAAGKGSSTDKKLRLEAAQTDYEKSLMAIRHLFNRNLVTVSDAQLRAFAKRGANNNSKLFNFANDLDKFGIAALTVQPATTAANFVFGFGRIGIDAVDNFFSNVIRDSGRGDWRNPFRGSLDVLKYMTTDREVTEVLKLMATGSNQVNKLFRETSQVELDNNSTSLLSRAGTALNVLNQISDNTFKSAVFTASVSRSLRELNDANIGVDIEDFIRKGGLFSDLPENIVKKAVDDSLRYTFQKGYEERDTAFAQAANWVLRTHQRVPFAVSTLLTPFPRYIANHLEFFHDYMPGVGAMTMARELATGQRVEGKDMATRLARQMTGLGIFSALYGIRAQQGADAKIGTFIDEEGNEVDTNRILGPLLPMYVFADLMYRYNNDLPIGKAPDNLAKIEESLIGTGLMFEGSGMLNSWTRLAQAWESGYTAEEVANRVSDVAARFTYPLAAFRDALGQFDPRNSIKPYTRSTQGDTINLFDLIEITTEPAQRFARFMPDIAINQWFESLDGKRDLPLWWLFNNRPVQEINPLMKQLTGLRTNVPPSALQRELARLNIEEWTLFGKRNAPNPSLHYAMLAIMAREDMYNLPGRMEEYINSDVYTMLPDELKAINLRARIAEHVSIVKENTKLRFEQLVHEQPNLAMGYLRNDLLIRTKNMRNKYSVEQINAFIQDKLGAPSAERYLERQKDIPQKALAIQQLLQLYDEMESVTKGVGSTR
jgi:hypothetical protein